MAKDRSLKSGSHPPTKKKKNAGDVHTEDIMDTEVKKKRKKMEVEVSGTVFSV